jgi:transposase
VVLMNGRRLADAQFPATAAGYRALLEWMRGFGRVHAVGVEGTGSYGAALARQLGSPGVRLAPVRRVDRAPTAVLPMRVWWSGWIRGWGGLAMKVHGCVRLTC